MKTHSEILNERLKINNYASLGDFLQSNGGHNNQIALFFEEVAKQYAIQVARDVRIRCAENAELISGGDDSVWGDYIDKQSILYTDIILP